MTNSLDMYRLPPEVADGTWMELEGTEVKALIRLPTVHNEMFQGEWLALVGDEMPFDDDGEVVPANMVRAKPAQRAAFIKHCLMEVEGLPDGVSYDDFVGGTYQPAIDVLMSNAQKLARQVEAKAAEALKNSKPFSNGRASGKGKKTNTPRSKKAESSVPKTTAPH